MGIGLRLFLSYVSTQTLVCDIWENFGGNILMGNDAPCKFVSICFVQIKMHDSVVRTLTDVLHVPELKKNLVFVGAMDSKGFSCWVKGGVM